MKDTENIIKFIKEARKRDNITQVELSKLSGVGLRFIKELEGGKQTVQVNKVNQVLKLFGHILGPIPAPKEDKK